MTNHAERLKISEELEDKLTAGELDIKFQAAEECTDLTFSKLAPIHRKIDFLEQTAKMPHNVSRQ